MTGRIRWTAVECGTIASWFGYVGSAEPALFSILHPLASKPSRHRYDEWALCTMFPGAANEARYASTRDPDDAVAELKAEAERWLERFVASLGAIFPEQYAGHSENEGGTAVQVQPQCAPHPEEETGR